MIPDMRRIKILFSWWSHLDKIAAIVQKVYFHQLIKKLCCTFQLNSKTRSTDHQNRFLTLDWPITIKNWGWLEEQVFRRAIIEAHCFHPTTIMSTNFALRQTKAIFLLPADFAKIEAFARGFETSYREFY